MQEDLVVVVNRLGDPIGTAEKLDAHMMGFRHLAFSVLLYRYSQGQLELLMQKRAFNKYHSGGLWSNTCCSHPRPDEAVIDASVRRLDEELGINQSLALQDIGTISYYTKFSNGLAENELDHIVIAECDDVVMEVNPQEAEVCEWQTLEHVEEALKSNPDSFSAWFGLVINKVKAHLASPAEHSLS